MNMVKLPRLQQEELLWWATKVMTIYIKKRKQETSISKMENPSLKEHGI